MSRRIAGVSPDPPVVMFALFFRLLWSPSAPLQLCRHPSVPSRRVARIVDSQMHNGARCKTGTHGWSQGSSARWVTDATINPARARIKREPRVTARPRVCLRGVASRITPVILCFIENSLGNTAGRRLTAFGPSSRARAGHAVLPRFARAYAYV